jgi:hypothetical protein
LRGDCGQTLAGWVDVLGTWWYCHAPPGICHAPRQAVLL